MARRKAETKKQPETLPIRLTDTHGNVTAEYSAEMVETIKSTVATDATDSELIMFLSVANKYDLDPFLHEIYFAKFQGNAQIMSGRDGYRKIAKREPNFKKCQSFPVRKNDEFEVEMEFGEIKNIIHKFKHTERGDVVGAYAVLKTTDHEVYFTYCDIREYDTKQNAWRKYKSDMICKVAETRLYKSFANINGIQAEESMPRPYDSETQTNKPEEDDFEWIETEVIEDDRQ